jgi:hypothetical protein
VKPVLPNEVRALYEVKDGIHRDESSTESKGHLLRRTGKRTKFSQAHRIDPPRKLRILVRPE